MLIHYLGFFFTVLTFAFLDLLFLPATEKKKSLRNGTLGRQPIIIQSQPVVVQAIDYREQTIEAPRFEYGEETIATPQLEYREEIVEAPKLADEILETFCRSRYGNPCGPLYACIDDTSHTPDSEPTITCKPIPGLSECNVPCGDGATCVQDKARGRFECVCDFGYQKPDPYLDCKKMDGFDGSRFQLA